MSSGESNSDPPRLSSRLQLFATPTVRSMVITWVLIIVVGYSMYAVTDHRNQQLQQSLNSTQTSVSDLDRRLRSGDSSAIAEIEVMRKRVEEFDQVLGTQREQFQQLANSADQAKSRRAVERANVAALLSEVTVARKRLDRLKSNHADWTARRGSLLTGDLGRKVASSRTHLELASTLLQRERPTEADLNRWELQLEALADPIEQQQERKLEIAITPDHAEALHTLGTQLTQAVATCDQQSLLLDALIRETAANALSEKSLEETIRDQQAAAELASAERLALARKEAKEEAERLQAERLAQLEKDVVSSSGQAQEDALRAKRDQVAQLGKAEADRIEEETRVKEALKRAETAGLKEEKTRVELSIQVAALEREFERDLPEIKGLLSAFLTPGFKYRNDNAKGPASLSHLSSQKGLESTANGSYAMAFLANASDRPAGGLKNPASPERIRRAQDLLRKYGQLMVEKKMLDP